MKDESNKNKYYKQLLLIAVLIVLPITMIIVNGTRAIEGILWKPEKSQQEFPSSAQHRVPVNRAINPLLFGIYDPSNQYSNSGLWDLKQIYISWLQFHPDSLRNLLQGIIAKNTTPVLTIEPWSHNEHELMPAILNGEYDNELEQIKLALRDLSDTVLISWGHEMDQDLTERYPWSDAPYEAFILAYRYVHDYLSADSDLKINWIWSPVGKRDCAGYWPGDHFVDVVGIPLYSFPEWERQIYGYIRSFQEVLDEKYTIVSNFEKPVYVIEFGVTGSDDFKAYWLRQAFLELPEYPLIKALLFFNAEDTPGAWGEDIHTPDWRVDSSMVFSLIDWYRTEN